MLVHRRREEVDALKRLGDVLLFRLVRYRELPRRGVYSLEAFLVEAGLAERDERLGRIVARPVGRAGQKVVASPVNPAPFDTLIRVG